MSDPNLPALVSQGAVAAIPDVPAAEDLSRQAEVVFNDIVSGYFAGRVTAEVKAEAQRAYAKAVQAGRPADSNDWLRWLTPLRATVGNAPSRDLVAALAVNCGRFSRVPLALLNEDSQARAVRQFKFWPSLPDLEAFFKDDAQAINKRVSVLKRMADATLLDAPVEPAPVKPGHYAEQAAALKKDLLAQEFGARVVKPTPAHISPAQRVIELRRIVDPVTKQMSPGNIAAVQAIMQRNKLTEEDIINFQKQYGLRR